MQAEDKFFGKKFIKIIFDVSVEWASRRFLSHVMAQQGEAAELVPFELLHLELVSHIIHGEAFYFCSAHLCVAETKEFSAFLQLQLIVSCIAWCNRSRRGWWRTRQCRNIKARAAWIQRWIQTHREARQRLPKV